MVDTVIFDMDGLMFDTERLNQMIYLEVYGNHGYPMTKEIFNRTIGEGREGTFRVFAEAFGAAFTMEAYLRVQEDVKKRTFWYATEGDIPKMKGLDEILSYLKERGYRLGVCTTSATSQAQAFLENAKVTHYFTAVVGGDQVERSKPFPDLYQKALEVLSVVPDRCIALEDSNNGVYAAHQAGIRVIMIPDMLSPSERAKECYFCLADSLLDVPAILEGMQP